MNPAMNSVSISSSASLVLAAVFGLCLATLIASPVKTAEAASTSSPSANNALVGVWRCNMNGLIAVTLNITDEDGSLNGSILFYLHRREPGHAETATPGLPEPLMHPHFDGSTFSFEVSHRRAHPPQTLHDAPVKFTMKLNSDGTAGLVNLSERSEDPHSPLFEFTRSDY